MKTMLKKILICGFAVLLIVPNLQMNIQAEESNPDVSQPATTEPTEIPEGEPTTTPSLEPSEQPTAEPTEEPTATPSLEPSEQPTVEPSEIPEVSQETPSPSPTGESKAALNEIARTGELTIKVTPGFKDRLSSLEAEINKALFGDNYDAYAQSGTFKVEYNASRNENKESWKLLNFKPTGIELITLKSFDLGSFKIRSHYTPQNGKTETITQTIKFEGLYAYISLSGVEKTVQYGTDIATIKADIFNGIQLTNDDLAHLPSSYDEGNGELVDDYIDKLNADFKIEYKLFSIGGIIDSWQDLNNLSVNSSPYTIRAVYIGNEAFQQDHDSLFEGKVTVTKAPSSIVVNSKTIKFGESIPTDLIVPSPAGLAYITAYVGLTATGEFQVMLDGNAQNQTINEVFKILKGIIGDKISFNDFMKAINSKYVKDALTNIGFDTQFFDKIEEISENQVLDKITITFNVPKNAGAFVVMGTTISPNHENAYAVGSLLIKPDTSAKIKFNKKIVAIKYDDYQQESINAPDYGYTIEGYDSEIHTIAAVTLYAGLTFGGETYLSDKAPIVPGAYTIHKQLLSQEISQIFQCVHLHY